MGLAEEELPDIVQRWRGANPRIRDLWYAVEQAALEAMQTAQPQAIHGLIFALEGTWSMDRISLPYLPAGRKLFTPNPSLRRTSSGVWPSTIIRWDSRRGNGRWLPPMGKTYREHCPGDRQGLPCGNPAQDRRQGLQVVFHVHDEGDHRRAPDVTVDEICALMAEPIPWAPGLVLKRRRI